MSVMTASKSGFGRRLFFGANITLDAKVFVLPEVSPTSRVEVAR